MKQFFILLILFCFNACSSVSNNSSDNEKILEDYRKLKTEINTLKHEIDDLKITTIVTNKKSEYNTALNKNSITNVKQIELITKKEDLGNDAHSLQLEKQETSKTFQKFKINNLDLPKKRPIIFIKFNKNDINYEEPLYEALKETLEKNNSAMFYIEGITKQNTNNTSITKRIEKILKSLTNMGIPASRISIIMKTASTDIDEIRIYKK